LTAAAAEIWADYLAPNHVRQIVAPRRARLVALATGEVLERHSPDYPYLKALRDASPVGLARQGVSGEARL
jgi:hypothetical protein